MKREEHSRPELSDYERGFLEALIDGEGAIFLIKRNVPRLTSSHQYIVCATITNTCRPLLEKARNIIGAGTIHISNNQKVNSNWKPCYVLSLTANVCRWLLPRIHLINKEDKRILAMEALVLIKQRAPKHIVHTELLEELRLMARGRR